MAEYIKRDDALRQVLLVETRENMFQCIKNLPAADVVERDVGIRIGAELAAMHRSDATSKDLERAYWTGFEEAMKKRDVRPVVRGKWEGKKTFFHDSIVKCSLCGNFLDLDGVNAGRGDANFCPNCGAQMEVPTNV